MTGIKLTSKKTIKAGKTAVLSATVKPGSASVKKLRWTSSNNSVASVNQQGKVTAKKKGTAVITAQATDGSKKKAACKVTVTEDSTTKTKAVYTIKKYSKMYYGQNTTGKYLFELPVLKGSSSAVKKINSSLKKLYQGSLEDRNRLKEYTESHTEPYANPGAEYYFTTTCKASWNKKGIVSFCFTSDWFAGGVSSTYHYGASYSLKTGRKLELTDVIAGGTSSKVKNKIIAQYAASYAAKGTYTAAQVKREMKNYRLSQFNFYLKNGQVIINCGAYAPMGGNGEYTVRIKGKY